jgi:hypothetical protein
MAPFDVLRSSGVPHITYDPQGKGSMIAEYRYLLTTDRIGTFTIPSFEARLGTNIAHSRPVDISVGQATRRGSIPTVVRSIASSR